MIVRPPVPGTITTARVLIFIQGGLTLMGGLILLIAGGAATSSGNQLLAGFGGAIVVIALIVLVIGALLIWMGVALGRMGSGSRTATLIVEYIFLAFGVLGLLGSFASTPAVDTSCDPNVQVCGTTTASHGNPIVSLLQIAYLGAIIYCVQFAPASKAAYAAARGQVPGQPYYPGQPGAYGAPPPPPGYGTPPPPPGYGTPPPPPGYGAPPPGYGTPPPPGYGTPPPPPPPAGYTPPPPSNPT